jgi:hypothetical protein
MRGRAAYVLGKIGILDEKVLNSLKSICEDYKRYVNYVFLEEGPIQTYDLAFRMLWQNAPGKIEEIA